MEDYNENKIYYIELGADHFDDVNPNNLKDKKCGFVLFYAPWCGHCNTFKPVYNQFAFKNGICLTGAVNVDVDQNKSISKDVNGYPTVRIYRRGKFIEEYSGERNIEALMNKAMKVCDENCKCCF